LAASFWAESEPGLKKKTVRRQRAGANDFSMIRFRREGYFKPIKMGPAQRFAHRVSVREN
jgi:hypothetical protein